MATRPASFDSYKSTLGRVSSKCAFDQLMGWARSEHLPRLLNRDSPERRPRSWRYAVNMGGKERLDRAARGPEQISMLHLGRVHGLPEVEHRGQTAIDAREGAFTLAGCQ